MNTQLVHISNNRLVTTSLDIAQNFGKKHKEVLRTIQNIECSQSFRERNFTPTSYLSSQNKELPMYEITRDGFVFLCMGFTGHAAAAWKEKYIAAFNTLEAEVNRQTPDTAALQRLQAAYLADNPEAAELVRYYEMGLKQHEIGKLLNISVYTVRRRLKYLNSLDLCSYTPSASAVHTGRLGIKALREKQAFAALQLSLPVEG